MNTFKKERIKKKNFFFVLLFLVLLLLLLILIFSGKERVNLYSYLSEYNLARNEDDTLFLCFLSDKPSQANLGICFNKVERDFSTPAFDSYENNLIVEIDQEEYAKSLQLVTLDQEANVLSIKRDDHTNYIEELISLLENLQIEDFISFYEGETKESFVDFHNYISVKTYLLKYYKDRDLQKLYKKNMDEIVAAFSGTRTERDSFAYLSPANYKDIGYLYTLDAKLAGSVEKLSTILAESTYNNIQFHIERGDWDSEGIPLSWCEDLSCVDLYKMELFIIENDEASYKYRDFLKDLKMQVTIKMGISEEDLLFALKYLPIMDNGILEYFKEIYDSDYDRFLRELETLMYYYHRGSVGNNIYQIPNILLEELNSVE